MDEKWTMADNTASPESFLPKSQLKSYENFQMADASTPPEELFRPKSYFEEGVRHLGRTVARSTEAIVGLPGGIASGALGLANAGISKLTGKPGPLPEKLNLFGIYPGQVIKTSSGKEIKVPEDFSMGNLPTPQDVREGFTQKITGNLLEPESKGEEAYDEVISDAAPILLGGLGSGSSAGKAALRALGVSSVGNAAKWATETVTGSPLAGAAVKIGTMVVAGTAGGRKELGKIKDAKYIEAGENLPKGASVNAGNQLKKAQQIGRQVARGDNPEKAFLGDRVKAFEKIVEKGTPASSKATGILDQFGKPIAKSVAGKPGGNTIVQELIDLKKGWNNYLADPKLPKEARATLTRLVGIANEAIDKYGKTNANFFKPYKIADELHGALVGTNYIQNIVNKSPLLQSTVKNPIVKHMLYGGVIKGVARTSAPKIAAAAGTVLGAREVAKTIQLLVKSPYAQKAYGEWLLAGLRDNVPAMAKAASKLSNYADKLV